MALASIITLSGCEEKKENTSNNNQPNNQQVEQKNSKGKCSVTECIKQIKNENTVEEINDIIGFEGELKDEKIGKYEWKLNDNDTVIVTYYGSTKGTIKIEYDQKSIANDNITYDKYNEIKASLDDGTSIKYDEFVEKMGNVQGVLIENSTGSKTYIWARTDGRYLKASFSNSSGKCTFITGRL
jgi:hypothetical protein